MFIFAPRDGMHHHQQSQTSASTTSSTRRPINRYTRASTSSVTQLLSDSCSNLLQRFTNRVRGPSTVCDRSAVVPSSSGNTSIASSSSASSTPLLRRRRDEAAASAIRSRLEEKYCSVLDRKPSFNSTRSRHKTINPEQQRRLQRLETGSPPPLYSAREEKTLEPDNTRSEYKSTRSNSKVLLSEKAYPYVSSRREKTPVGQADRRAQRLKHAQRSIDIPASYSDRYLECMINRI